MVKRDLIQRLIIVLVFLLGLVVLRIWFLEPIHLTEQMSNDYLSENDFILAVKNPKVTYGDFLVYRVDGEQYAGRVIAMEKDQVTYMADVLYRNHQIIPENYLRSSKGQEYFTDDFTIESLTEGRFQELPKDTYLVLNDNRSDQRDSRQFGLIAKKQVIGRLSFRLTPLAQFGFIENGLAD